MHYDPGVSTVPAILRYRPEVDGLRAIAVSAVIAFHASDALPGGFAGVDVFFVISGYLITSQIWREQQSGTFSFGNFWARRIRRIAPACMTMMLVVLLAGSVLMLPNKLRTIAAAALSQVFLASNFHFAKGTDYFDPSTDQDPLLHTWSLSVEEQFYLLFPLLLVGISRVQSRLIRPFVVLAMFLSFTSALVGEVFWPFQNFYWPFGRAWELILGASLALSGSVSGPRRWHGAGAMAGLALIFVSFAVADSGSRYPGTAALIPTIGTFLVLHCTESTKTAAGKILGVAPLRAIGAISYSLYLWHWPVLAFIRYAVQPVLSPQLIGWALGIMLLLAILSWRFVEQPFRARYKGDGQQGRVVRLFVTASISLLIVAASIRATRGLAIRPWIKESVGVDGRERGAVHAHEGPVRIPSEITLLPRLGACSDTTHPLFLLWGDSHAMAISSCLDRRAAAIGICGSAAVRAGQVPILDPNALILDERSASWNEGVIPIAASAGVRHLLLCSYWSSQVLERNGDTTRFHLDEDVLLRWQGLIRDTIERALSADMDVWVLAEVPTQPMSPAQALTRARWTGVPLRSIGADRSTHSIRSALLHDLLGLWNTHPRVHVIDLGAACFMDGELAPIGDENLLYYFDQCHLTDEGAERMLGDVLDELLASMCPSESNAQMKR